MHTTKRLLLTAIFFAASVLAAPAALGESPEPDADLEEIEKQYEECESKRDDLRSQLKWLQGEAGQGFVKQQEEAIKELKIVDDDFDKRYGMPLGKLQRRTNSIVSKYKHKSDGPSKTKFYNEVVLPQIKEYRSKLKEYRTVYRDVVEPKRNELNELKSGIGDRLKDMGVVPFSSNVPLGSERGQTITGGGLKATYSYDYVDVEAVLRDVKNRLSDVEEECEHLRTRASLAEELRRGRTLVRQRQKESIESAIEDCRLSEAKRLLSRSSLNSQQKNDFQKRLDEALAREKGVDTRNRKLPVQGVIDLYKDAEGLWKRGKNKGETGDLMGRKEDYKASISKLKTALSKTKCEKYRVGIKKAIGKMERLLGSPEAGEITPGTCDPNRWTEENTKKEKVYCDDLKGQYSRAQDKHERKFIKKRYDRICCDELFGPLKDLFSY